MIDARVFDDLSATLGKLLPPGMAELRSDFEHNARAAMQSALSNLDLVTREEFDVQVAVLHKTRARLKELEERVVAMESSGSPDPLNESSPGS